MNGSHWRDSVPIKPADALEKLASYVRERMDKRRRAGPKWTFRLAPDLIIQIQPLLPQEKHKRSGLVVKELLEFDGMVVEDEATSASDFDRLWGPDKKHFGFRINHEWVLRGRRIGGIPHERESWPVYRPQMSEEEVRDYQQRAQEAARLAPYCALRDRVVEVFNGDFFSRFRPASLLGNHCICCGRALTDPVSQSRFIGPECYGSASRNIPWITDLSAPEDQAA
jgi:hypothetical protein